MPLSAIPLEAIHSNSQSHSLSTSSSLTFLLISAMKQEEIHLIEVERSLDEDINTSDSDDTDVLHNSGAFVTAKEYLTVSGSFLLN